MDTSGFEEMLASGRDNALLRFTMGSALYRQGQFEDAAKHLKKALKYNPQHSATWKLYGRVLVELGRDDDALTTFKQGIEVAMGRGDVQAVKEMTVFLRRLEKAP